MDASSMGRDIISSLHDSVLVHVLSYLPIGDLVRTSVLSKRWEFMWLNVSDLYVNSNEFLVRDYGVALGCFIDKFLEFKSGSRLQKFKITFGCENTLSSLLAEQEMNVKHCALIEYNKRVVEWIAEVILRGFKHLDVGDVMCPSFIKLMPKHVYASKTLVSLKLVNVGLEDPKSFVSLPRLKILHLENVRFKNYVGPLVIQKLILGSPLLENLTMDFIDSRKAKQIVFNIVPRCLSSTLEYVRINKMVMKKESGIRLANYFLENSALLKNLTLNIEGSSINTKQEAEDYKKLLTSTKRSSRCQIFCSYRHRSYIDFGSALIQDEAHD